MSQEQTMSQGGDGERTAIGSGEARPPYSCSFCGKPQAKVWRLIAGPGVYICSECIELCVEMLVEGATATNLDEPTAFRATVRQNDGTVEQVALPLPEPGEGEPPRAQTKWLVLCPTCGALNAGIGLETCLHCQAPLPRPGEPVHPPVIPWHAGFSRPELRSFVPALRAALELAQEEAAQLGHTYMGTEHLLLGLLRQQENAATTLLSEQGVTVESVRQGVLRIIGPGSPPPATVHGYSQRAREVLRGAIAEARLQGRGRVGPEDLLLALLRETGGVAAMVLTGLGIDPAAISRRLQERMR